MKINNETVIGKIGSFPEIDGKSPKEFFKDFIDEMKEKVDKIKEEQNQAEKRDWKIEIIKVDNGYIVKGIDFESDKEKTFTLLTEEKEISGKDDNQYQPTKSQREAMIELLKFVADYFGFHYDKWARHNLKISFDKKGRKAE